MPIQVTLSTFKAHLPGYQLPGYHLKNTEGNEPKQPGRPVEKVHSWPQSLGYVVNDKLFYYTEQY